MSITQKYKKMRKYSELTGLIGIFLLCCFSALNVWAIDIVLAVAIISMSIGFDIATLYYLMKREDLSISEKKRKACCGVAGYVLVIVLLIGIFIWIHK